jgi:hypothetical protein
MIGVALRGLAALGLLVTAPYLLTPVYEYSAPTPFAGERWYDPYADTSGRWLKANFHAHSKAWGPWRFRGADADDVVDAYCGLFYDVPVVTNYLRPEQGLARSALAAYEHGYSIRKSHRVSLGATDVWWHDFPLWQATDHKQYLLDRLAERGGLVAIAHPGMRDGHTAADARSLAGYHAIEVLNRYAESPAVWDAALGAGRAVWALGVDDAHGYDAPPGAPESEVGVMWTMVRARSTAPHDVLDAVRAGRTIAVKGRGGRMDLHLRDYAVRDDILHVTLTGVATAIRFVGPAGRRLHEVVGAAHAAFALPPDAPYVRVEVATPRTVMYLNPVVRWDGSELHQAWARPVPWATWMLRTGLAGAWGTGLLYLLGAGGRLRLRSLVRVRRRRVPVTAPAG